MTIIGTAFGVFAGIGALRFIAGGKWSIEVNEQGIHWQSPKFSEKPFQYKINEISHIEKRTKIKKRKDGSEDSKSSFYLVALNNETHWLQNQSGCDIQLIIEQLQKSGIKIKEKLNIKK